MIATLESIGLLVVDYYALATVPLLAATLATRWIEQPARRLAVAWSTLLGLTGLLVLVAVPGWPRASLGVLPIPANPKGPMAQPIVATAPRLDGLTPSQPRPAAPLALALEVRPAAERRRAVEPMPVAGRSGRLPSLRAGIGGMFVAGMVAMLGWLGLGTWRTTLLRRRARQASARLQTILGEVVGTMPARLDLLVSDELRHPLAMGTWRPTIILPARLLTEEPAVDLRVALTHEWAHIQNRDL